MSIKILDKTTQEQIAAGEVIERPASVVKELVDNSIDSGATKIEVDINGMGLELIKIVDDGCGMSRSDLEIATLRHATSKIDNIFDLETIATMGFRGEALSTIYATSKLEIITKTEDDDLGNRLVSLPGEKPSIEECGSPKGTQILVRDLFFNMPARKKFMKSRNTEILYIHKIIENLSMAFPEIHFTLRIDGRDKLVLPMAQDTKERLISIFGDELFKHMTPINFENSFIKIKGFTSNSSYGDIRKTRQYTFLNNRPIVSKIVYAALNDAYKDFITRNKYPAVFLFIEMNGNLFDVNVHPQKTEVKFLNESGLFSLLRNTIRDVLRGASSDNLRVNLDKNEEVKQTANTETLNLNKESYRKYIPTNYEKKTPIYSYRLGSPTLKENNTQSFKATQENLKVFDPKEIIEPEHDIFADDLVPIAWLPDSFIIAYNQAKDLVIIDQHAAHERILFEKYKKEFIERSIKVQNLLIPETFEVPSHETVIINNHLDLFKELGFDIEAFGKHTYKINSIPAILAKGNERKVFLSIMTKILDYHVEKLILTDSIREEIIQAACKSSVKAKDKLTIDEMKRLVQDLLQCDQPYNCPHGRPTIIKYSTYEIQKKFERK